MVNLSAVNGLSLYVITADLSVLAAGQGAPGEGLDSDGGMTDHEEQLSDHHHAVGLLDH